MTPPTNRSPITFFVVALMSLITLAASTVFAQQNAMFADIDRTMGETAATIWPTGALSGEFMWTCEHGRVRGQVCSHPHRHRAFNR